jgi:hypothetical protein
MKNLQDVTERVCELKGNLLALDALMSALLSTLPASDRQALGRAFEAHTEVARTLLLHAPISDLTIAAFDKDVSRMTRLSQGH